MTLKKIKTQQRYSLIERAPDPILVVVPSNLEVEYVNQAALRLLGQQPVSLVGTTLDQFIPGFFSPEDIETIQTKCSADGESVTFKGKQLEILKHSESPVRWLDVDCEPMIDDTEGVFGVVCYIRDVTPQRTLDTSLDSRQATEQKLQAVVEQLEERNKELEAFSYVASHDLKEPLRKIMTYSDRLKSGDRSAIDEYLTKINTAAARMMDLIESVLKFSQMSNSSVELMDVDLKSVLEQCKSDLEVRVRDTGAVITSHDLGSIRANSGQMNQLFLNLIGNSLKFCDGMPQIDVALSRIDNNENAFKSFPKETPYWCLRFSDNGIGFDLKYKEEVFEPFKRLHAKSTYPGAGIGLSIVKKIVDRHKGHIDVDSTRGVGTKFTIYLPVN